LLIIKLNLVPAGNSNKKKVKVVLINLNSSKNGFPFLQRPLFPSLKSSVQVLPRFYFCFKTISPSLWLALIDLCWLLKGVFFHDFLAHSFAKKKIVGSAYWNDMVPDPSIRHHRFPQCGHYHSMARPLPISCGKRCVRHNGIITLKRPLASHLALSRQFENDRPLPISSHRQVQIH
jgi:hypothetical protein